MYQKGRIGWFVTSASLIALFYLFTQIFSHIFFTYNNVADRDCSPYLKHINAKSGNYSMLINTLLAINNAYWTASCSQYHNNNRGMFPSISLFRHQTVIISQYLYLSIPLLTISHMCQVKRRGRYQRRNFLKFTIRPCAHTPSSLIASGRRKTFTIWKLLMSTFARKSAPRWVERGSTEHSDNSEGYWVDQIPAK